MFNKILKRFKSVDNVNLIVFVTCFIVYTFCAFGKNAFSSANAAIVSEGLFTKDNLGLISACFWLFYSFGQLFGGRFVDKTSPVGLVITGLAGALISCFIISSTTDYLTIFLSWCIGGLLQFAIWPACISVISTRLDKQFRQKALLYFSFTTPLGMLLSYLFSSVILINGGWQNIFSVTGIILALMLLLWVLVSTKLLPKLEKETEQKTKEKSKVPLKKILSVGIVPISIGAFIRSMLDLGVKAWIPTMIMETYSVSASFSVFLTIFLILINVFGVFLAQYITKKFNGNEVKAASIFFLLSIPFAVGLIFMEHINLLVAVFLMAMFTTFMSANTQIILIYMPVRFDKFNCVGTMSGFLNAVAAFGSFFSTYIFGIIAENLGWTSTIFSWIILAAVAFVTYISVSGRWGVFIKDND